MCYIWDRPQKVGIAMAKKGKNSWPFFVSIQRSAGFRPGPVRGHSRSARLHNGTAILTNDAKHVSALTRLPMEPLALSSTEFPDTLS